MAGLDRITWLHLAGIETDHDDPFHWVSPQSSGERIQIEIFSSFEHVGKCHAIYFFNVKTTLLITNLYLDKYGYFSVKLLLWPGMGVHFFYCISLGLYKATVF